MVVYETIGFTANIAPAPAIDSSMGFGPDFVFDTDGSWEVDWDRELVMGEDDLWAELPEKLPPLYDEMEQNLCVVLQRLYPQVNLLADGCTQEVMDQILHRIRYLEDEGREHKHRHTAQLDHLTGHRAEKPLIDKTIILAGITYECSLTLTTIRDSMLVLASYFRDYRIVIYENDSPDDCAAMLRSWMAEDERVIVFTQKGVRVPGYAACRNWLETNFGEKCVRACKKTHCCLEGQGIAHCRVMRLAYYRNIVFKYVREHLSRFDTLMWLDLDIGWGLQPVVEPIVQAFTNHTEGSWDVLCANGKWLGQELAHYDVFALRATGNFPREWGANGHLLIQGLFESFVQSKWEWMNAAKWFPGDDWVPMHACFGGFYIWNNWFPALEGCTYESYDCEHVTLFDCVRAKRGRALQLYSTKTDNEVDKEGPFEIDTITCEPRLCFSTPGGKMVSGDLSWVILHFGKIETVETIYVRTMVPDENPQGYPLWTELSLDGENYRGKRQLDPMTNMSAYLVHSPPVRAEYIRLSTPTFRLKVAEIRVTAPAQTFNDELKVYAAPEFLLFYNSEPDKVLRENSTVLRIDFDALENLREYLGELEDKDNTLKQEMPTQLELPAVMGDDPPLEDDPPIENEEEPD